jgi:hypothetical protein
LSFWKYYSCGACLSYSLLPLPHGANLSGVSFHAASMRTAAAMRRTALRHLTQSAPDHDATSPFQQPPARRRHCRRLLAGAASPLEPRRRTVPFSSKLCQSSVSSRRAISPSPASLPPPHRFQLVQGRPERRSTSSSFRPSHARVRASSLRPRWTDQPPVSQTTGDSRQLP